MTEIIENVDFVDFNLTLIRVLKIIEIFKEKDKFLLMERKIVMFDYYMRFPFMTDEDREKQNFDDKYAFYFWQPNYSLYEAVLAVLLSKEFIVCRDGSYYIESKGVEALSKMDCEYMKTLSSTGQYVLNTVIRLSDKKIEEDILNKSKQKWEGLF